jgi:hypothetical protein
VAGVTDPGYNNRRGDAAARVPSQSKKASYKSLMFDFLCLLAVVNKQSEAYQSGRKFGFLILIILIVVAVSRLFSGKSAKPVIKGWLGLLAAGLAVVIAIAAFGKFRKGFKDGYKRGEEARWQMSDSASAAQELPDSPTCDWQLPEGAQLIAKLDPWPATAGPGTVRIEVTIDDFERQFNGTLECRIALAERNSDPWYPVKAHHTDEQKSTFYDIPIKLRPGTFWIQFRAKVFANDDYTELTGWKVVAK